MIQAQFGNNQIQFPIGLFRDRMLADKQAPDFNALLIGCMQIKQINPATLSGCRDPTERNSSIYYGAQRLAPDLARRDDLIH